MITTIVLDAGHGGIDPITRKYTTAPAKMHRFNNGETAYEGVINMKIAKYAETYLKSFGLNVVWTRPKDSHIDTPLKKRVNIAKEFKDSSILWSIHNNAGGGTGFEIFTTRGQTTSDIVAEFVGRAIKDGLPNVKFRKDTKDGDLDKEADFYVLRKVPQPAILTESHFFDNTKDWELLKDESHLRKIAYLMALGVFTAIRTINIRNKHIKFS